MGLIHIYCGDGKGKTTASVGLTVRALGCNKKVLFAQFFKNGNSGEVGALKSFENLTYLKAEKTFGFFSKMNDEEKSQAKQYFNALLNDVIEKSKDYDMLVLDEIMSSYNYECINRDTLLNFCKENKNDIEIVLTGRNPAEELTQIADYVSCVQKVKHPYDNGVKARRGVEF